MDQTLAQSVPRKVLDLECELILAVRVVLLLNAVLQDADPLVCSIDAVLEA